MANKHNEHQKRTRKARAERENMAIKALKDKRNKKIRKIAIAALLALATCAVLFLGTFGILRVTGTIMKNTVILSTDNFEVDAAMMSYFMTHVSIYDENYYREIYGDYYDQYCGFDSTAPLRKQNVSETETWFDYIAEETEKAISTVLAKCEYAKANGIALTESDMAGIESRVKNYDMSIYRAGVKKDTVRRCLELEYLSEKADLSIRSDVDKKFTDEYLNNYYAENKNSVDKVDYSYYEISYLKASDTTTEGKLTREQAVERADTIIAAAKNLTDFKAVIDGLDDNGLASIKSKTAASYSADDKALAVMFSEDGKLNYCFKTEDETNSKITVYIITKDRYKDETETVTVRHILFTPDSYKDSAEAKAKAEEVYAAWKQAGSSEADFASLAIVYSDDSGSSTVGGIYDDITKEPYTNTETGEMNEYGKWSFDESRKPGDSGIIETSYGYHVMYFVSQGRLSWMGTLHDTLFDTDYKARTEAIGSQYAATANAGGYKTIID